MPESTSRLFPCAHCKGSGTCSTGENGCSCNACARAASEKKGGHGLYCGVCKGIGMAEIPSDSFRRTIEPGLALLVVVTGLLIIFAADAMHSPNFPAILAAFSTMIGGVLGYCFAGKRGAH